MKIIQSGINTLHVSNAILREYRTLQTFRKFTPEQLSSLLTWKSYFDLCDLDSGDIDKFQSYCREISGKEDNFRVGILMAHGTYSLFGKWCYEDGFFSKPVQVWIDKNDGVYDLLLLHVCNPRNAKPTIRKSIGVIPTNNVGSLWKDDKPGLVIPSRNIDVEFNLDDLVLETEGRK